MLAARLLLIDQDECFSNDLGRKSQPFQQPYGIALIAGAGSQLIVEEAFHCRIFPKVVPVEALAQELLQLDVVRRHQYLHPGAQGFQNRFGCRHPFNRVRAAEELIDHQDLAVPLRGAFDESEVRIDLGEIAAPAGFDCRRRL